MIGLLDSKLALQISADVTKSLRYGDVINAILDRCLDLFDGSVAALLRCVQSSTKVSVTAVRGSANSSSSPTLIEASVPDGPTILPASSDLARLLAEGLLCKSNGHRHPWGALCLPMVLDGSLLGAIIVAVREPPDLQPEQTDLLTALSKQFAIALRNVTRYQQVRRDRRRRLRDLTMLNSIVTAINSSLELQKVLDEIVKAAAELTMARYSSVTLLDNSGQGTYIAAMHGLIDIGERYWMPIKERTCTWQAILHRKPIEVLYAQTDERFPSLQRLARDNGFQSCLCVPLMVRGEAFGSLDTYLHEARQFDARELQLMTTLADQASVAIENASLYASIVHEKRKLDAVIHSLSDGLIIEDADRRILFVNANACKILGLSSRDMVGSPTSVASEALINHFGTDTCRLDIARLFESSEPICDGLILTGDGGKVVHLRSFDVRDHKTAMIGRGFILQDRTRERQFDRMKTALLSTVSHELKTPIANIKGFVTSLLQENVQWSPEEQQDFLQCIDGETDKLTELVDHLLQQSRIESGMLRIERDWCQISSVIDRIVLRFQVRGVSHRFRVQHSPNLPAIWAHEQRIEETLSNLLDNAIKYSPSGGDLVIETRQDGQEILVSVTDRGIGIPPDELEHVFRRFHRTEISDRLRIPGMGLGLAISRGIVEAHGGRIWAKSVPGQGSTFSFTLPILPQLLDHAELRRYTA